MAAVRLREHVSGAWSQSDGTRRDGESCAVEGSPAREDHHGWTGASTAAAN